MAMTVRYTVVNGEIIAEKRSGTRSLYVPDPHGSTIALLNSAQHITDVFSYWAYGLNFHSLGSNPTPFIFLGTLGYYKDDVNRTYVRARVMDKVKARWITQDPIGFAGGDFNLYRYVANSPMTKIDPSGMLKFPFCKSDFEKCMGKTSLISLLDACGEGLLNDCIACILKAAAYCALSGPAFLDCFYPQLEEDCTVECLSACVKEALKKALLEIIKCAWQSLHPCQPAQPRPQPPLPRPPISPRPQCP